MDKLSHLTAADIDRALTEKDLRGMVPEEGLGATLYVAALRTAWLLRLALQERPAVFGLVVTVLAVSSGATETQPLYWLNALTTILFLITAGMTIPSRDRILGSYAAHASGSV